MACYKKCNPDEDNPARKEPDDVLEMMKSYGPVDKGEVQLLGEVVENDLVIQRKKDRSFVKPISGTDCGSRTIVSENDCALGKQVSGTDQIASISVSEKVCRLGNPISGNDCDSGKQVSKETLVANVTEAVAVNLGITSLSSVSATTSSIQVPSVSTISTQPVDSDPFESVVGGLIEKLLKPAHAADVLSTPAHTTSSSSVLSSSSSTSVSSKSSSVTLGESTLFTANSSSSCTVTSDGSPHSSLTELSADFAIRTSSSASDIYPSNTIVASAPILSDVQAAEEMPGKLQASELTSKMKAALLPVSTGQSSVCVTNVDRRIHTSLTSSGSPDSSYTYTDKPSCLTQVKPFSGRSPSKTSLSEENNPSSPPQKSGISSVSSASLAASTKSNDEQQISEFVRRVASKLDEVDRRRGILVSTSTALNKHRHTHLETKSLECIKSGKKFAEKSQLQHHTDTKDCDLKLLRCDICTKILSSAGALKIHKFTHLLIKPFKCTKCEKTFAQKNQLQKHSQTRYSSTMGDQIECERSGSDTDTGEETVLSDIDSPLYSDQTKPVDTTTTTMMQSITSPVASPSTVAGNRNDSQLVPTELLPAMRSRILTPHCAGEPENSNELPDIKRNTNNTGTSQLQISGVTRSPDGISLSSSMSSSSTLEDIDNVGSPAGWSSSGEYVSGKGPHECSVCSKTYPTLTRLQRHVSVHSGEPPYACSICGRRFTRNDHVKQHMKVHYQITHSHSHKKMYEMGTEPGRRPFLDKLFWYLEEKGNLIHYVPSVDNHPIDLYRLYMIVKERGGSVKVTEAQEWIRIYELMNFKHSSKVSRVSSRSVVNLMKQYIKFLFAFECEYDNGGIDQAQAPGHTGYGIQDRAPATGSQGFDDGMPGKFMQNDPSMHHIGHRMMGNPKMKPCGAPMIGPNNEGGPHYMGPGMPGLGHMTGSSTGHQNYINSGYMMQGGPDPMMGVNRGPMGMGWYAPNSMMGQGGIGPQQGSMGHHSMIENMPTYTMVSHSDVGPEGSMSGRHPSMTHLNSLNKQQMMRNNMGNSPGPNSGPLMALYSMMIGNSGSVSGQGPFTDEQYWKRNAGPTIPQTNSTIPPSNYTIPLSNSMIPQPNSMNPQLNSIIPKPNSMIPQTNSTIPPSNYTIPLSNSMIPQPNSMNPQLNSIIPKPNSMIPQTNSTIPPSNYTIPLSNSMIPQPNSMNPQLNSIIPKPNSMIPQSNSTTSQSNSKMPQSSGPMISQNSNMPQNTVSQIQKGKKQKSLHAEIPTEKQDSWYECKKCGERLQYFSAFVVHVNNGNCRVGIDKSMFDSNMEGQKLETSVRESIPRSEKRQNDSINRVSENIEKEKMQGTNFSAQTSLSLINQKVLIKQGDAFYPGMVKTYNKKGTMGVLFDEDEELTYLLNSDCRCIVLDTIPSDDELPVGCMVCVRSNLEQDKYYEAEIVERQVGKWVWYRICLTVEKHKQMFGEDVWVTNTSLRLLQQSCFTMESGEMHILTKSQKQVSDVGSSDCSFKPNQDQTHKDSLNKLNDNRVVLQDVKDINEDKENCSEEETEKYASDEEERLNEVEVDIRSESSGDDLDTKFKKDQKVRIAILSESSDDGQGGRMNKNGHKLKKSLPEKKRKKIKRAKKKKTGLNADVSADKDIKHICDYCDDVFEDAVRLRQHRNIHIQKKPFFCEFCEKLFPGKVQLSEHLVICKNRIGKKINYSTSAATINSKKLTRENASDGLKKYICPFCKGTFSHYSSLWRHKKDLHGNSQIQSTTERKKYYCSFCAASFFSYQGLYLHKKKLHKNQKMTRVASIKKKYECKLCQSFYRSYASLWNHRKTVHKNDKKQESDSLKTNLNSMKKSKSPEGLKSGTLYVCGICNKEFSRQSSYYQHQRIHWKKKPFACKKCNRQFVQKIQLNLHKCVTRTSNFKCDYCGAAFASKLGLKIHRGHHSEENEKRKRCCNYCKKKYKSAWRLQSHMVVCKRMHSSEIALKLRDKVKNTDSNQAYERQLLPGKDDQSSEEATCSLCDRRFSSKIGLEVHNSTVHKKMSTCEHRCSLCCRKFPTKVGLARHNLYVHKEKSNAGRTCSLCDRTFSTAAHLAKHNCHAQTVRKSDNTLTQESSNDGRTCNICDRTFITKAVMAMHNKNVHKRKRPGSTINQEKSRQNQDGKTCLICSRQFSTRAGLSMHNYHVHSGSEVEQKQTKTVQNSNETEDHNLKQSTKCEVCLKIFSSIPALKKHKCVHQDKKIFKCIKCGETFTEKKQLRLHIKTDDCEARLKKGIQCEICLKRLSSLSCLRMHKIIHREIKPFKCTKCERTFAQKMQLQLHEKKPCGMLTRQREKEELVNGSDMQLQDKNRKSLDDPADLSHTCAICSSTFRSGEELHRHFKLSRCALGSFSKLSSSKETTTQLDPTEQIETQVKYECATCDMVFADCSYLELHMSSGCSGRLAQAESASEGIEKTASFGSFECGLCQLSFESDIEMISHFKLEHSQDSGFENKTQKLLEYVCGKCKSEFDSAENLGFHMQYCFQGNNSSVFTCGLCHKDYRNAYDLELHISEIHTQSEYLCGQCGESFHSSKSLVNHVVNEHSTVKDEAAAYPDLNNTACEDKSPDTGAPPGIRDKPNDAVVFVKPENKDACSIECDTNKKEVEKCKEQTIEVQNCSEKDNRFVSIIPDTLNSTLVTQNYKENSSKTSSSTDVCSNPRTSITDKELNNSNKQSGVLVDNSIKGDKKQTDLRPSIDTNIYQHLYKPKPVPNKHSDNHDSKSAVKDIQPVQNIKGYDIKYHNEQYFESGVETVPTSLLLRYMHQVQCDGCFNITKLNASGMCTFCQKPIVVKLHQIMCMCMRYCFRSIEVLTAHLRGCEALQAARTKWKHVVLSYLKQEGIRKISEADHSMHPNVSHSECSISSVKNSSDSLLQWKHYGNNSNENRTVSYDDDKLNKTNAKDSNENHEMMEENFKLNLVNADKMQDVDARECDEPSIIILDDYESESSETDSTGFKEICIDMVKDENNSEKPCGDNNGNSSVSSETALHRACNEHGAPDGVKYDQTLITSNIFSCKVILERMLQSEVEHHLHKRTSVAAPEKLDRTKRKQTKLEQFYGNSAKQRSQPEQSKCNVKKTLPKGKGEVARSNKDESNLEQQDTIVISSDSDNDSQIVDMSPVDGTCLETNDVSDKNRTSGESRELKSSLVSKNKSVARKRGFSKSNKAEHNSQKRRCPPQLKTSPKCSKSAKSVKDGNRTATVDNSHVVGSFRSASRENKESSNQEKLKSSSASKTAENLEKHANTQLMLELFKCSKCERVFSSADSLSAHMDSHKKAEEFVCGICQAKFRGPEDLENHLVTHFESVVASKSSSTRVASSDMTEIVDADSSTPVECPKQKDVSQSKSLISKLIAYKPNIKL